MPGFRGRSELNQRHYGGAGQLTTSLNKSSFKHKLLSEAAAHNSKVLSKHGFDLSRLIAANPNTEISCGSEFRRPEVLDPVLSRCKYWPFVKKSIAEGIKVKFEKISEENCKADLIQALNQGNHKSANTQPKDLSDLVSKDINFGFQLPVTKEAALRIPHACL